MIKRPSLDLIYSHEQKMAFMYLVIHVYLQMLYVKESIISENLFSHFPMFLSVVIHKHKMDLLYVNRDIFKHFKTAQVFPKSLHDMLTIPLLT